LQIEEFSLSSQASFTFADSAKRQKILELSTVTAKTTKFDKNDIKGTKPPLSNKLSVRHKINRMADKHKRWKTNLGSFSDSAVV